MDFKNCVAYDLDGVLAEAPPARPKSFFKSTGPERKEWNEFLAEWYKQTKPLLRPTDEPFIVITARKCREPYKSITVHWLALNMPHMNWKLFMHEKARTLKNVIAFKGEVLRLMEATKFTEDNKKVLKGVKELAPNCELFHFDGKESIPFTK
mgnify:CR=1 FL=1